MTLDWNDYIDAARAVTAEGCVLLKNDNNVLPFSNQEKIAVFGRIQTKYYKSGTGSGGLVNVSSVTGILEGLKESGTVVVDPELEAIYTEWVKENPFEEGVGWGTEPWAQKEMPVDDVLASRFAEKNDSALVIIGRTAGEDKDNKNEKGSYLLNDVEYDMLKAVRKAFSKMTVILNVGNIIDMKFVDDIKPDAVMYVWQGGMYGGLGTADVLTGKTSPSGKLTDTIAENIDDYPSTKNFGNPQKAVYQEDVYVGYRYFETVKEAEDKVLYPFGFGLSYTTFDFDCTGFSCYRDELNEFTTKAKIEVSVKNTGKTAGKEVVQIYTQFPQGTLGQPAKILTAFAKTRELLPGESEILVLDVDLCDFASFDDTGSSGHKNCRILEAGDYLFFAGNSVRNVKPAGKITLDHYKITEKLYEALCPKESFQRLKNTDKGMVSETVAAHGNYQTAHRNQELFSVKAYYAPNALKSRAMENPDGSESILIQLTDDDLSCIVRGEGMGSPKVTPGTAAAFGGVSEHLHSLGVPCGCCADGPSGIRMDSGAEAFSFPIGTMIACTFNIPLAQSLYHFTGMELAYNNVDVLLAPGMNLRRNPLNGRNFEYYSEDPFVTGSFAVAFLKGLHQSGVTGSLKHFACNNQEIGRHSVDSVVSARALRDIYLKGFEMAVKQGGADAVMTTYGSLNGVWTSGSFDLNTLILRKEWGFEGIVMTDWCAKISDEENAPNTTNFASMIRSQNDVYMVVSDASVNAHGDNTLASLEDGSLSREEMLRNADNIISFLLKSRAYKRLKGEAEPVEIINRNGSQKEEAAQEVVYYDLDKNLTLDMEGIETGRGKNFTFALTCKTPAVFKVSVTAKSDLGELAQMPVFIYTNGICAASMTWFGTEGKFETKSTDIWLMSKYTVVKVFFAQSGLSAKDISFEYAGELPPRPDR